MNRSRHSSRHFQSTPQESCHRLTDLQFSRARPSARGGATRSAARNERRKPRFLGLPLEGMWNRFLYWFYGGELYLAVVASFAAIALAALFDGFGRSAFAKRVAEFLALLSIPLAVLCAPPVPLWLALLSLAAGFSFLIWAFGVKSMRRRIFAASAIFACAALTAAELPYQLSRVHVPRPTRLFVIGDSLASGGFGEDEAWPEVLARQANVNVMNLALASADAKMATDRELPLLPAPKDTGECVFIEIGENDMIDGVPLQQFEAGVDRLLQVAGANATRRVVMLELTLLPGRWAYGSAQRRLAQKYQCALVPKRLLVAVQLGKGNTSDGAHFTQKGHDEFSRTLAEWLQWDTHSAHALLAR